MRSVQAAEGDYDDEGKCGGRLLCSIYVCSHRLGMVSSSSEIAGGTLCKIYIDGLFASSYFGRFLWSSIRLPSFVSATRVPSVE